MKYLRILKIFIPLTIIGYFLKWDESVMFFLSSLSIVPLAGYLGEATEEIAAYTGPKFGGFLNATFGNATEIIISFFALRAGLTDVVKASLAGSVMGNILLVLGCSIFFGGLKHKTLTFDSQQGNSTSSMLLLAIAGFTLPAVFTITIPEAVITSKYEGLSVIVGFILLIMYVVGMIYSFKTQSDVYGVEHAEDINTKWKLSYNIVVLAVSTILIAIESELLVSSIEPMTQSLGISKLFVGLILIPIVGNAAEHSTAVIMALKNKMDIALEIAIGSSLQISMFVVPLLVIVSMFIHPMSIVFKPIELSIFFASVLIANQIVDTGKTNWLEGLKLISVYIIAAVGFFYIG
jgi:Ca2+:H+ antiporter